MDSRIELSTAKFAGSANVKIKSSFSKPTVNICRYRFAAKAFPGQFPHPICGAQLFKVNERGH